MTMTDAIKAVEQKIAETMSWRNDHVSAGRKIEAAACQVRLEALKEVLHILKKK